MCDKTKRNDERQRIRKRRFETHKVLEDKKPARFSSISLKRTVQDAVGLSIEYFGGGQAKEKSNFVGSLALIEAALETFGLGFDLSPAVEIGALRVAVHQVSASDVGKLLDRFVGLFAHEVEGEVVVLCSNLESSD